MLITKYNAYLANLHAESYCVVIRLFAQCDFVKLFEFCQNMESEPDFFKQIINRSVAALKAFLKNDCNEAFFWIEDFEKCALGMRTFFTETQTTNIEMAFREKLNVTEYGFDDLQHEHIFDAGFVMMHGGEKIDAFNLSEAKRIVFHPRQNPVSDFKQVSEWGLYAQ